ncbi:MAG TPA: Asp-tRNA(Asn)/Glu-tRNA(Gln) amidotransferase subunit GatB [Candidatus Paceibacterota bacterium]|nr:Asp-tRNA(Asn)/Glu-tRNA(Gln) amidotransferase subunit GatB [Candidatus Paceibacterota bacterium]
MSEYVPTIGLEIHAELKTATKMFCTSKNDANETRPNVNVCPVCMAHPGTLPVINREAVRHVLRVGAALGGTIADYTEFDRKNYFYPDLPKGYQLSQYEFPLVSGGSLNGVTITRIHLEEDTASLVHDERTGETLIDYNRAGVPLMELVTEPVIHSAKEAAAFGKELQLLLRYLGVSDADMEKGHMRLEANISVAKNGTLGTKVEVKNINSFGFMERAIAYEIKRQTELLSSGGQVVQETRGWDDVKQKTFSQRVKEKSADYRYFPDPDLPSLKLSEIPEFTPEALVKSLPELPGQRRARYVAMGVKEADARQFTENPYLASFFDEVTKSHANDASFVQRAANYIANDLVSLIRAFDGRDTQNSTEIAEISNISADSFEKIMLLLGESKLTSRAAKDLLAHTIREDGRRDPEVVARELGLLQEAVSSDMVDAEVARIIFEHASVVADYKAGKEAALQFLIGQGMKALKGAANPAQLKESFISAIGRTEA